MRPELLKTISPIIPQARSWAESGRNLPIIHGHPAWQPSRPITFRENYEIIKDARRTDPARARAMVAEHFNALIGQTPRDFNIKYTSAVHPGRPMPGKMLSNHLIATAEILL